MRDKLLFLLKYYLFWIVFSWVAKVLFLIYQYKETATLTGHELRDDLHQRFPNGSFIWGDTWYYWPVC